MISTDDVTLQNIQTEELRKLLCWVPGRYWKDGDKEGEHAVYKREKTDECNNQELYICKDPNKLGEGWFLTDNLTLSSSTDYIAWIPDLRRHDKPNVVHIPYWEKEPLLGLEAWSLNA